MRRSTIWLKCGAAFLAALVFLGCGSSENDAGSAGTDPDAYRIGLLYFAPEAGVDVLLEGLFDGLREQGLEEGRNLVIERAHAQAEIANIPLLVQNFDSSNLDLIVSLTTPCLTAACAMARNTPVVFTYVFDPIAAGAGNSATDHLPHVTGVGSFPPVEDSVALIQRVVPSVRKVGTVYNSSEANSRESVDRGAVAAVGVGWHEAGRAAAPIIKRVLEGESPQGIPFQNVAVKKTVLNQEVARTLGITFPADLVEEAAQSAAANAGVGGL